MDKLLNEVEAYLSRFVAYPSDHTRFAHVLWIIHTHLMDEWESTPRLAFLSPEPGSGKTRALEITETLVPRPIEAVSATPAYLFRKVADPEGRPTILYDEIDTVFGPRAKENEEIRGMLNAGHRRGAMAGRCVMRGKTIETEELPAFCAVALAGLGKLPDTVLSRSVVIRMRRRSPHEKVEPYRRRLHACVGYDLRNRILEWADSLRDTIGEQYPKMPEGVEDRNADVWEPLIAVADAAGGRWPELARVAAVTLVTDLAEDKQSLGVRLLTDLCRVFDGHDHLPTQEVLKALHTIEEAPWGSMRGEPLDPRGLANLLRPYHVSSTTIRISNRTLKGYTRGDLHDSWIRYVGDYLSSHQEDDRDLRLVSDKSVTKVTEVTRCAKCDGEGCAWCEAKIECNT